LAKGSFGVTTNNQYISGRVEWSSTTDIAGNYSKVKATLYLSRTNTGYRTYGSGSFTLNIGGSTKTNSGNFEFTYNSNTVCVTHEATIYHNDDGKKNITISVSGGLPGTSFTSTSGSKEITLDTIPRASSISSGISWTAGTQNLTVSVSRASSNFTHGIDMWVQTPSGANNHILWRGNIGSSTTVEFTKDENTKIYQAIQQYENRPVLIRLYTYSGNTLVGSNDKWGTVYAHATGTIGFNETFNIGNSISCRVNNYHSNFTYDVEMFFGNFKKSWANVGQNPTLNFTQDEINLLYQQVPNANSGNGTVRTRTKYNGVLVEDGIPTSHDVGFTAYVVNSNPTLDSNGIWYEDINEAVLSVTGNSQYIVQNKSHLRIHVDVAAEPKNYASINRYEVKVNGVVQSASTLGWYNFNEINSSVDTILEVTAVDSRGNKVTVTKTIKIIPYQVPTIVATVRRKNNFETETLIEALGSVSELYIDGIERNEILDVTYHYREVDGEESGNGSLVYTGYPEFDVTDEVIELDNTKAWEVEISVQDVLGTVSSKYPIDKGIPLLFVDADMKSVSFGAFPTRSNALELFGSLVMVIEDEGSNENGEYIRFNNGIQFCWLNTTFTHPSSEWMTRAYANNTYYYVYDEWTFPKPFIAPPSVQISGDISGAVLEHHGTHSINSNYASKNLASLVTDSFSPKLAMDDVNGSINAHNMGAIQHAFSAEVNDFEIPDRDIVIVMNDREVGRGVFKHVSEFQEQDKRRKRRFS